MPIMGHGIIWSCAHDGQNTKKNFVRRFICFNTQKNKKANGEKINQNLYVGLNWVGKYTPLAVWRTCRFSKRGTVFAYIYIYIFFVFVFLSF